MKNVLAIALLVFASGRAFAGPKSRWIECVSQQNNSQIAVLTFLTGGNLQWEEPWHSAASVGELRAKESFGNVYELVDFYSDKEGSFQLVMKSEFIASGYSKGFVEVLFKGKLQDSYFCNNNL